MKSLPLIAAMALFTGCSSKSETVIYRWVRAGDTIQAKLAGWGPGTTFRVFAQADGEKGEREFFFQKPFDPENYPYVQVDLKYLNPGPNRIRLFATGKRARWEEINLSTFQENFSDQNNYWIGTECRDCNIVIYIIDAMRADRLGCYGYNKATSPHIDEFSKIAFVFNHAYAPATWTRATVASIFTGLDQPRAGGTDRDGVLAGNVPTIAEILKKSGYHTVGYVSNGNIAPELGFGRGFDEYVYIPEDPAKQNVYSSSQELLDRALPKLEKVQEPFFAYIHVTDPHAPYTPPEKFANKFIPEGSIPTPGTMDVFKDFVWRNPPASEGQVAYLSGLYDGEVAAADEEFGRFLDWLKSHNLDKNTWVILTSDHGEEFYDHGGLGHGGNLYNELLHVPLIVGFAGMKTGDTLSSGEGIIDAYSLFSSGEGIIDAYSLYNYDNIYNRYLNSNYPAINLVDLFPYFIPFSDDNGVLKHNSVRSIAFDEPIYAYEKLDKVEKESIIIWPYKLIHNINRKNQWGEDVLEYEFYNIETDPTEQNAERGHEIARRALMEEMEIIRKKNTANAQPSGSQSISPELKKRLQALGY